jgi:benzoate membrane transport protein
LRRSGPRSKGSTIQSVKNANEFLDGDFQFTRSMGSESHEETSLVFARCMSRGQSEQVDPGTTRGIHGIHGIGVFGVTLAAVFMAFPATFITTLAGLALLGTIGGSLASAMADAKTREASLITFLAAAANITMLGIGGPFWGLVIGLVAYAVLTRRGTTTAARPPGRGRIAFPDTTFRRRTGAGRGGRKGRRWQ